MKNMKRISKVTIKWMPDNDPGTSWMGQYSDRAETDYAIDRRHSLDCPVNSGTDGHCEGPRRCRQWRSAMTMQWTDHAARQLEDRATGWRDWLNWLLALCVGMALWGLGGVAAIELGWWR